MSNDVKRFEDLIAWQKARALVNQVYRASERDVVRRDYRYTNQLCSAAVSVMANIAEGFERGSAAEFHRFLTVAKSSCAEVRSHLYIGLDVGRLTREEFERLMQLADEIDRIVGALRVSVGRRRE